jgi:formylglycine-generating enzyme required for sulfatase activity
MESVAATLRDARAVLAEALTAYADEEGLEEGAGIAGVVDSVAVDKAATVAVAPPPPPKKVEKAPPASRLYPVGKPEIEMVFVGGGKFRMGCRGNDAACTSDERPPHEVKLGGYYIGKYPITQKQWAQVMGVNPAQFDGAGWETLPVEQVSWDEVQEFIKRLNVMTGKKYRLPTEAEWEYAALGGGKAKDENFSGHRFLDDVAWYDYNSFGRTHGVGGKQPNELGLHDMLGNVWEWVQDWYDRSYYRDGPLNNPKGPKNGTERVYRGGSFNSDEQYCRVSLRNYAKPGYRTIYLGFRLASSDD